MNIVEAVTQNLYPREFAVKTPVGVNRFIVRSEPEVLAYTRMWNYVGDIYFGVHALQDIYSGTVRRIYFDFDCREDLEKARVEAEKVYSLFSDCSRLLVFSGNKGYHVHVFFKPAVLKHPSQTLRKYVLNLASGLGLAHLDVEPSFNIRGMARLPGTYNIRGRQVCQIILCSLEGDGERVSRELTELDAEVDKMLEEVKASGPHAGVSGGDDAGKLVSDVIVKARLDFREEVAKLAEEAQKRDLDHEERLILLFEAINRGWTDQEILELFRRQGDFNPKITLYMINHARSRGYKPYSRSRIREVVG
jgi:hypothetical protein